MGAVDGFEHPESTLRAVLRAARSLLETIAEAVAAGAWGPIVGHSIWQPPDPERVVTALGADVHDGVDPVAA